MKTSNLNLIALTGESKTDGFYASHKLKFRSTDTHFHDFYEFHVITEGTLTEYINGHKIEMGPGWVYFLRPYDVHEYHSHGLVSLYKIQFMIDILDSDIQRNLLSNDFQLIMKLSDKELETIDPFLRKLVDEYNSNKYNRMTMVSYLMNCLTTEMLRLSQKYPKHTSGSNTIITALEYIHRHYTTNITMQQVAAYVGLTPNYFCSKFHNEVGQPFKQYLRGLQLNHAATLLRVTDLSVSRICEDSGFISLANFLKEFKGFYGMTPSQYRKQATPNK